MDIFLNLGENSLWLKFSFQTLLFTKGQTKPLIKWSNRDASCDHQAPAPSSRPDWSGSLQNAADGTELAGAVPLRGPLMYAGFGAQHSFGARVEIGARAGQVPRRQV